jgi:hypothetical protein
MIFGHELQTGRHQDRLTDRRSKCVSDFDIRCPVIKAALSNGPNRVGISHTSSGKGNVQFPKRCVPQAIGRRIHPKTKQSLLTHYIHSAGVRSDGLTPPGTGSRDPGRFRPRAFNLRYLFIGRLPLAVNASYAANTDLKKSYGACTNS